MRYSNLEDAARRQPSVATIRESAAIDSGKSLLGRIIACWTCAFEILSATVKNDDWAILFQAAERQASHHEPPTQLHAAICRLRQAVIDLFAANRITRGAK